MVAIYSYIATGLHILSKIPYCTLLCIIAVIQLYIYSQLTNVVATQLPSKFGMHGPIAYSYSLSHQLQLIAIPAVTPVVRRATNYQIQIYIVLRIEGKYNNYLSCSYSYYQFLTKYSQLQLGSNGIYLASQLASC